MTNATKGQSRTEHKPKPSPPKCSPAILLASKPQSRPLTRRSGLHPPHSATRKQLTSPSQFQNGSAFVFALPLSNTSSRPPSHLCVSGSIYRVPPRRKQRTPKGAPVCSVWQVSGLSSRNGGPRVGLSTTSRPRRPQRSRLSLTDPEKRDCGIVSRTGL
ncbi:hypothetical protein BCR44DRAFT_1271898 [Catenaria anguillulae PL171]|uniref:Uncharacterized protein n=1 Tax=Catenaria anguillulae PL171 TaxID=765915 RepID=A0A1Y2HA20_9FUNG|nr:hypothetical protein BCR44DRAFT_1271898 [Catenaria anguillulae PL171]